MTRKNEYGFGHLMTIIFFVVTLASISVAGWYVATHQLPKATPASTSSSDGAPHPTTGPAISASEVVSALTSGFRAEFPTATAPNSTSAAVSLLGNKTVANDPLWESAGYDFYTSPTATVNVSYVIWPPYAQYTHGASAASAQDIATVQTFIDKTLADLGFDKLSDTSTTAVAQEEARAVYTGRNALCRQDEQSTMLGTEEFGITCADYSSFLSSATALKPFAEAYYLTYPQFRSKSTLTNPVIQDSSTAGYKVADVIAGHAHGKFYTKNGQWHFLHTTQSGQLNCKDYANQDARLAFLGTSCFTDAGTQSTVQ